MKRESEFRNFQTPKKLKTAIAFEIEILFPYFSKFCARALVYCLPFDLFGLLWKSYLGGLGAHFGTKEKCSLGMGIAVFFVLSLIGFLIPFVI